VNVGDLIRDKELGDVGLIVEIDHLRQDRGWNLPPEPYCIWYDGKLEWHKKDYIEKDCEVVSEGR
tara:strand:- start:408 stop:602 length:195 start_codon:yes stop_codon:yes gene_type:complete